MSKKRRQVSIKEVLRAARSASYIGFCLDCGHEQHGVEPDAREYVCEACGEPAVYGAEWILVGSVG